MKTLKEIQKEKEQIDIQFEKSFEKFVIELLQSAHEDSYDPYEDRTVEEIQMHYMKNAERFYFLYQKDLYRKYKELVELEEKIKTIEIDDDEEDDLQLIIDSQIRYKIIKIEKHYRTKKDEYNVFDWLSDADPENFLGYLREEE